MSIVQYLRQFTHSSAKFIAFAADNFFNCFSFSKSQIYKLLKRKFALLSPDLIVKQMYMNVTDKAQIHGRINKGILDDIRLVLCRGWLPEDPSDILSIFPFLSDRLIEPE
jgi:hypothetical protein